MLEYLAVSALLFLILVFFYKQAVEEYSLSQIEVDQLAEFPKLMGEKNPVVIRSLGEPKVFTAQTLQGNRRLAQFPLGSKDKTLGAFLDAPTASLANPLPLDAKALLAREAGVQVWAEHVWFRRFNDVAWMDPLYSLKSYACLGEEGLRKTTALSTLILPTSGKLEITLLNEPQATFLPPRWRSRFPETFNHQDTPLAGNIKTISVVLRTGSALSIPPHWYYSVRSEDKPALWVVLEFHHPISRMAAQFEANAS